MSEVDDEHLETAAWILEEEISGWLNTRYTDTERKEIREALDAIDNALD